MGSAVLGMIVDVEVAGSGLESKVSMIRFLGLSNFLKKRFISLNTLGMIRGKKERRSRLYKHELGRLT